MQIKKINNLERHLPKSTSGYKWPTYKITNDNKFFLSVLSGNRGAGKSLAMYNILLNDSETFFNKQNHVYYISPTFNNDFREIQKKFPDNFTHIDTLDAETFDALLKRISDNINEWKKNFYLYDILQRFLKKEKISNQEQLILEDHNYLKGEHIENFNFNHVPISTLIFDDLMGNPMISAPNSKIGKKFISFVIKHRHPPHFCNLFFLVQYFRGLSKPIRSNCSMLLIWPTRDKATLKNIFEEFSGLFHDNIENWLDLCEKVEKRSDHSFILLYQESDKREVRINFNELVTF